MHGVRMPIMRLEQPRSARRRHINVRPRPLRRRANHAHSMPTSAIVRREPRNLHSFNSRGFHDIALARQEFARSLETYDGNRNLDRALGRIRPNGITTADYYHLYQRGGIAAMLVDKLPTTALRSGADILEGDGIENRASKSPWEKDVKSLFDRLHAWEVLREAIIESRKANFAIILIGVANEGDTPTDLKEPLQSVPGGLDGITFLRPFGQSQVHDPSHNLIDDESSPLLGFPKFYQIVIRRGGITRKVHHSRVIHISNRLTPWGISIYERVFDDCQDLRTVTGSGAEGTFQNVGGNDVWTVDPEIDFETGEEGTDGNIDFDDKAQSIEDSIAARRHGVIDDLILRGVTKNTKDVKIPEIADNAKLYIQLMAAASGYPFRVLFGTEEGKLAGEQDSAAYADDVKGYREGFCTRHTRQLIDRFMLIKALAAVTQYTLLWQSAERHSPVEKSEIAANTAKANRDQSKADGRILIDVDEFRRDVYGYEELEQTVIEPNTLKVNAIPDDASDEVVLLDEVINTHEVTITNVLNDAYTVARESTTVDNIVEALESELNDNLPGVLFDTLESGAESTLGLAKTSASFLRAASVENKSLVDIDLVFNPASPSAISVAEDFANSIIADFAADARLGLNVAITQGEALGFTSTQVGRLVSSNVGLGAQEVDWVFGLARRMADGAVGDTIDYGASTVLLDGTQVQIDNTVSGYINHLHTVRDRRLARSWASRVANEGTHELWRQALSNGDLPDNVVRVYVHNTSRHLDRSGQTVAIGESFDVEPGEDINCQCTQVLEVVN